MARPRQVLDEEILEAARACFIEHGVSVSTETIAARLGVSGPALLKRFGSKRELLKAAFSIGKAPPWLPMVEVGPDARELTVQLREVAGAIDTFFRAMVPAFAVMREAGITPEELRGDDKEAPAPARTYLALAGWFRRAQEQGRLREGDPGVMASLFVAGLQYRYFLAHVTNESVPTEAEVPWLERMVDIFWRGVAPGAQEGAASAEKTRASRGKGESKRG
ncbi:TetR/AcrR family transcriptional regulator [Archangium lansingense]|uniref:TetR/AcrR family transcriptional regulator n=1 Tax=Archangium lansingense TaxID=2995310 RepID=A0ABT4APP7_9BACT|nr:TetR/AcrR family transcriptional regulator [Archangium lansinium]MCY1083673.1 TetR/AcrR family transcriptional regulator [Archangium lansinium]